MHPLPHVWNGYSLSLIHGLGSFPFARRYLGNRFFFLFLGVLRCFSSPGIPSTGYVFTCEYHNLTCGGLPHSDIHGSMLICSSPWLFAACHVLLRLPVPRHPPYALICLTENPSSFLILYYSCYWHYAVFKVQYQGAEIWIPKFLSVYSCWLNLR